MRPALTEDLSAMNAIAMGAKRHWGYPERWLDAWRDALTIRADDLERHTVIVAGAPGDVVGFAVLADARSHWSLEHLWVAPSAHGRGIGRMLLYAVRDAAAGRRSGVLRIESDPFAVGFYERCGARPVGFVSAPVLGEPRQLPVLELHVERDIGPRSES
ncbi:MAG TPA: GNAT family N-acetyltransferase [Gemmatimonadaceae bacterium]|nr:GNAT family N-acetyltransferase [Gemmatimonadaceae bacterium]